jgi:hypothetical protein
MTEQALIAQSTECEFTPDPFQGATPWQDPRTASGLTRNPNSRLELGEKLIRREEAQTKQRPRHEPKDESVYERDDNIVYVGGFDSHIGP